MSIAPEGKIPRHSDEDDTDPAGEMYASAFHQHDDDCAPIKHGLNNTRHLAICQNIEAGLKKQYELHPDLSDSLCILALDNAKIAIKKQFGYAKNENLVELPLTRGVIDWCVSIGLARIGTDNGISLKEYVNLIDTVKRSVARHSVYGPRAYYEFIQNYV